MLQGTTVVLVTVWMMKETDEAEQDEPPPKPAENRSGRIDNGEQNEIEAERNDKRTSDELPLAKKQKTRVKKKMTTAERVTAAMTKTFAELQERSEEKFLKFEERRAREDRAHAERMLRILLASQSSAPAAAYSPLYFSEQNYSNDFQNDSFSNSDF